MSVTKKAVFSILCLFVLFFTVPSIAQIDNTVSYRDDFQTVLSIFKENGLKINEIKLQVWGKISNRLDTYEQIHARYRTIAEYLDLKQRKSALQTAGDGFKSITHLEERHDGMWQINLQSLPIQGDYGESYLGVLYVTKDVNMAEENYCTLVEMFNKINFSEELGVTISGLIPGYLSSAQRRQMSIIIAKTINAKYIEGISDQDLTSMSFFSDQVAAYRIVNDKKINLNIAMHYDMSINKTHLYIGIPLIYQDY